MLYATFLLCLAAVTFISATDTNAVFDVKSHPAWKILPHSICGKANRFSRIIGGKRASAGQFPWLIRIGHLQGSNWEHFCGGSIISKRFVLTASHCFLGAKLKHVVIITGDQVPSELCVNCPSKKISRIEKLIRHKGFEEEHYKNDLAVVKVDRDIQFNDYVAPICLVHDEYMTKNFVGETAQVGGWGVQDMNNQAMVKDLFYTTLPIIPTAECDKTFSNVGESQICVNVSSEGSDSCYGDSGGPLMKKGKVGDESTRRYHQIGIVSYGTKCAIHPAVYTKLSYYMKWILDVIQSTT